MEFLILKDMTNIKDCKVQRVKKLLQLDNTNLSTALVTMEERIEELEDKMTEVIAILEQMDRSISNLIKIVLKNKS